MQDRQKGEEAVIRQFSPLFSPKTVAVVGASARAVAQGNRFIRQLREFGFGGAIFPVHQSEESIEGLPAYRSLADTPEPVDYAYVAIASDKVPGLLSTACGRVRFAQVMSSGFGEIETGRDLEKALVHAARQGGMRLIGPNCMGTYSARGGLTFVEGGRDIPGNVGVMSQSGGLAMDLLLRGHGRGLHYSSVISIGNCADLGADDFLTYFLADPDTKVIGAYLEHVANGRRFFEQLRDARAKKPVVILKGGRTRLGARAAASHTGSLADNDQVWLALSKQTGALLVDTLDEFIDALVAFQAYTPRVAPPTGHVVLFGNGGGASVLATDFLAKIGLEVTPLDAPAADALNRLQLPAGASVANPIDIPANILQRDKGALAQKILEAIAQSADAESILMHLNLPVLLGYRDVDMLTDVVEAAVRAKEVIKGRTHISLSLRSNGEPEAELRKRDARLRATKAGIPVFDEIPNQARATAAVHSYERFRYVRSLT